ncbi:hypothetical protein ACWU4D_03420 [Vibrio sp. WJH972]
MGLVLFWFEKGLLTFGVIAILLSIVQYGIRTRDWGGIATMFFKRVPMSVDEFRRYRLGIAMVIMAFVIKVITLTFWPGL